MPKSKNSVSHFHVKTIQIRNFLKKYTVGIEVASSSIWKCNCSVEDEERYYWAENSSKKQAKKIAAFHMLCYILYRLLFELQ